MEKETFMHDAFTRITAKANTNTAPLDRADLDQIKDVIAGLNKRLDAVQILSSSASCCVSDTIAGIICQDPSLADPGGPCYPNRKMAACLRDCEIILRYVSYALMAGDVSVLEDRCLKGLKETLTTLNVCMPSMVRAINLMKTICVAHIQSAHTPDRHKLKSSESIQKNITSGDCSDLASECTLYFERIVTAIVMG
jgi:phycoerythrin beta chain